MGTGTAAAQCRPAVHAGRASQWHVREREASTLEQSGGHQIWDQESGRTAPVLAVLGSPSQFAGHGSSRHARTLCSVLRRTVKAVCRNEAQAVGGPSNAACCCVACVQLGFVSTEGNDCVFEPRARGPRAKK